MRKRAVSLILCLCMVLSLVPVPVSAQNVENDNPFTDVKESDWFYDGVQYVFEHELMQGTSSTIFETLFEPERATQRGMIVTILYRLDESPPVTDICPFEDVPRGSNYENAIIWAESNGIVTGYTETSFGPYDDITRQQMAAILYRYANFKRYDVAAQANLNVFTDSSRISNYARIPLSWANAEGLINGITPTILAPTEKVTRAQSAVILKRFCENMIPTSTTPSNPTVEQTSYTVTFDLNYLGGGVYQTLSVKAGEKISAPQNPKRGNYNFLGWYTATTGGSEFNFDTTINTTTTLYARWKKQGSSGSSSGGSSGRSQNTQTYYTVSFSVDGGTSVLSQSVVSGGLATQPSAPTKNGYSFAGWYTNPNYSEPFDFTTPILSNVVLYAKWDISTPAGSYKVTFNSNGGTKIPAQTVLQGETVEEPDDPEKEDCEFFGWYTGLGFSYAFDFETPIQNDIILYAKWYNEKNTTDTDNDGIPDELELEFGSDPSKDDTDNDGLSDFDELNWLNYDPSVDDTDGNGVLDKDEDPDGDGLTNIEEKSLGTNMIVVDTDHDGLSDFEEARTYGTSPTNPDTDGDGVDDGTEIVIGSNPLVAEVSFSTTVESNEVINGNPDAIDISVTMNSNADGAGTLAVTSVSALDNPLVSPMIPGFLNAAYEISSESAFNSAVVSFTYGSNVGTLGDDFQPRIYYLNEETGQLEELENQVVSEGRIRAEVSHFSTYLLLNKVDFDEVWDAEIKPPFSNVDNQDDDAILDIVFVIDYSASMDENDPQQIFKELSKGFVSKLRDGKDRAGVVKFIKRATVVSGLTNDKEALYSSIDSISYDDRRSSYSGTDGSAGLKSALDMLNTSESEYQYIVFITDGEDNGYSYSYDSLIQTAVENHVVIDLLQNPMNAENKVSKKREIRRRGIQY